MTTSTPFSSPLYLWIDTKTDAFPNPTLGLKSRTRRTTTFHFQTEACNYFVDVIVEYAEEPEDTHHNVKIRIDDYLNPGDIVKQTSFIPNDGRAIGVAAARALADIHLTQYVQLN